MRIELSVCSAAALTEAAATPSLKGPPPDALLGTTLSSSASRCSNCIYEPLGFISTYFVHLIARCILRYPNGEGRLFWGSGNAQNFFPYKLRVIASSLYTILAYRRFCRILLSDSRGTLHIFTGHHSNDLFSSFNSHM